MSGSRAMSSPPGNGLRGNMITPHTGIAGPFTRQPLFSTGASGAALARANDEAGVLQIAVNNEDVVTASIAPSGKAARSYDVHVARLGFEININVKAGENSGRKLLPRCRSPFPDPIR